MSTLEVDLIGKRFADGTVALDDVSFTVGDGELVTVVGPSGCGKSTLLRIVAGLEQPTDGILRVDGRIVNERSPQERNVAMVFQEYALYPHLTVRGNLEFPLRRRGLARAERGQRVARVAELLGLEPLLGRRPRELSGGQSQRVAMGRALVREPSLFLLDEPLSNLDARLRLELRHEIAELQRRTGTTTLFVTHDQVEAMSLGQRVVVLRGGRIHQVGTPRELYDEPRDVFVAQFIGSPGMNVFEGRIERGDGGPVVRVGAAALPVEAALADRLGDRAGPVLAGMRPEELVTAAPADNALAGEVLGTEILGREVVVRARTAVPVVGPDGERAPEGVLAARLDARALDRVPRPGEALRLKPARPLHHLFGEDLRAVHAG